MTLVLLVSQFLFFDVLHATFGVGYTVHLVLVLIYLGDAADFTALVIGNWSRPRVDSCARFNS